MYRPYNNLRARIYQYGYTAGSLAAQIGLSPQQMSARMRGDGLLFAPVKLLPSVKF